MKSVHRSLSSQLDTVIRIFLNLFISKFNDAIILVVGYLFVSSETAKTSYGDFKVQLTVQFFENIYRDRMYVCLLKVSVHSYI